MGTGRALHPHLISHYICVQCIRDVCGVPCVCLHSLCRAQDADEYALTLSHGDVLLLATDGLWDNVDIEQIVQCVTSPEGKVRVAMALFSHMYRYNV